MQAYQRSPFSPQEGYLITVHRHSSDGDDMYGGELAVPILPGRARRFGPCLYERNRRRR